MKFLLKKCRLEKQLPLIRKVEGKAIDVVTAKRSVQRVNAAVEARDSCAIQSVIIVLAVATNKTI